jgi:hypothetical protein
MPRIQTNYLRELTGVGRPGATSPSERLLAYLADFKPQNYGMRGLVRESGPAAAFCQASLNNKEMPLAIALGYPRGTDRSRYFRAYECMGAALICRRLIGELFPGRAPSIAKMTGIGRRYDQADKSYKDESFAHYAVDITGLLAEQPGLEDQLRQMGVVYLYDGRKYLDPIPHNIRAFTSAERYEMIRDKDLLENYVIGFNEPFGLTWPANGRGIGWSARIVPPGSKPGLQGKASPLMFLLHGAALENDDYTGENFSFGLPVYPNQWELFVRCTRGARLDKQALEPGIEQHCQISPQLSLPAVKHLILDEGMDLVLELMGLLNRVLISPSAASLEGRGRIVWQPYITTSLASMPVRTIPKVGRNDPCPCGSGKKYKKCCGD